MVRAILTILALIVGYVGALLFSMLTHTLGLHDQQTEALLFGILCMIGVFAVMG